MPDEAPGGTLWRAANANRPSGPSRAHWAQRKAGDVAIAVSGYVADTPLDSSNPVALPTRWATYWRPPSTAYGLQRRYNDVPTAVSGYVTDTPLDVSAAPGGTLHRALSAAIYRRGWNYPVQLRRVIDAAEPDALLNPAEPVPFATYQRRWTYPQQLRVLLDVSDPDALLNPSKLIPASTYRRGWVYPSQLHTTLDVSTSADDPLTTPPLPVRQAAYLRPPSAAYQLQRRVLALYPPQPLPFVEPFTYTTGQPWNPANWISSSSADGSVTIDTNRGLLGTTVGAYAGYAQAIANHIPAADVELTCTVDITPTLESYLGFYLRGSGDWAGGILSPTSGWRFNIEPSGNSITIDSSEAGVSTNRATGTKGGLSSGGVWNIRFRVVGTGIQFRIWQGTEPGTWDLSVTSSLVPGAGVLQGGLQCGSASGARNFYVDDINLVVASDDPLATPPEPVPFATYRRPWTYPRQLRVLVDVSTVGVPDDALLNPLRPLSASVYRRGWVYPNQLRPNLDVSTAGYIPPAPPLTGAQRDIDRAASTAPFYVTELREQVYGRRPPNDPAVTRRGREVYKRKPLPPGGGRT